MLEAMDFAYNERDLGEDDYRIYKNVTAGYILDDGELHSWGLIYELRETRDVYAHHMDVYTVPHARGMGYGTLVVKALKQLHDGFIYTYKGYTSIYSRLGL
jgi:GNAT superfamily N-acetyltransferase